MKTSFRVTQLIIFLLFSVLVLFFSFSTHLGSREEQSRVVFVAKFPAFINSGDSKKDLKIDDERRTLRLIERFNLMEESFGENWTNIYSTNPLLECTIEYANANKLQQDHPCVIELIRKFFLHKPASPDVALNLKFPNHKNPSDGQSQAILQLLGNMTNGFFVESGGFNGEAMSNTLYMERFLNWTGILIEPDNITFPQLIAKKRKSWALPVCLSLENYPTQVTFNNTIPGLGTAIVKGDNKKMTDVGPDNPISKRKMQRQFNIQCFPLYSILLAVNRTSVDFISLDVEGHEFRILKTLPWHKIDAKVMSVEWDHVGEGEEAMSHYMILHGFVRFGSISESYTRDVVYFKDYLEDFRNVVDDENL